MLLFLHEFVMCVDDATETILQKLSQSGIQGGYNLRHDYPELGECLLICVTETKTTHDLERYVQLLRKA